MKWIDLFQFLNERANDLENLGKFPWQEDVSVFDWETLRYYDIDVLEISDNQISFGIDTSNQNLEINNESGN